MVWRGAVLLVAVSPVCMQQVNMCVSSVRCEIVQEVTVAAVGSV